MINYSFIIPHKNVFSLLKRCVDSIPYREDIEIIIIDDNSDYKDKLSEFNYCDDERIRLIILSESKGAGYARNEGIKVASGKWLLFADADDYYESALLSVLDKYLYDNITDIVYFNAQSVDEYGSVVSLPIQKYIENYSSKRFYSEKVLRFAHWAPWTRMVRRELVNKFNIKFEEIPVGNDAIFSLTCSKYSNVISVEPDVIYNYYQPSIGSYTSRYYNISNLESMIELKFRINALYDDVGFIFKQTFLNHYYSNMKNYSKEYSSFYKSVLQKHHYSLLKDLFYLCLNCGAKICAIE